MNTQAGTIEENSSGLEARFFIQLVAVVKGTVLRVMRQLVAKLIVFLLTLTMPCVAAAQVWLPSRASREGPGIKLGESLVFHPGAGVEGGYDTNPLREAEGVSGAGRLRVTPYLDLATRARARRIQDEGVVDATPPKVNFRLGLAAYYDWFFSDKKIIDEQDHLGVNTDLNFILFPEGAFSLLLDAAYLRTQQPYESPDEHWSRNTVRPGIGFRLRPGGGTLALELGYNLELMLYEDDFLSDRNNNMEHEVRFEVSWKVFPKTAIISKMRFSPKVYLGDENVNNDSMPVRSLLGIQGLLTNKFGLALFAGYGASFYERGDDFNHVIANGELMFFITPFANIRIGGQRDFVDSYYANFYVKNGGYVKYEQMFAGIFLASLKGDVFYRDYSAVEDYNGVPQSTTDRGETWIGAVLLLEVRATEWLSFHASAAYQGNLSSFEYDTNFGQGVPVKFHRFEVFGGVRAHY